MPMPDRPTYDELWAQYCRGLELIDEMRREHDELLAQRNQATRDANEAVAKLALLDKQVARLRDALADLPGGPAILEIDDASDSGIEPGDTIAKLTCPSCGCELEIMFGDEPGCIGALSHPKEGMSRWSPAGEAPDADA